MLSSMMKPGVCALLGLALGWLAPAASAAVCGYPSEERLAQSRRAWAATDNILQAAIDYDRGKVAEYEKVVAREDEEIKRCKKSNRYIKKKDHKRSSADGDFLDPDRNAHYREQCANTRGNLRRRPAWLAQQHKTRIRLSKAVGSLGGLKDSVVADCRRTQGKSGFCGLSASDFRGAAGEAYKAITEAQKATRKFQGASEKLLTPINIEYNEVNRCMSTERTTAVKNDHGDPQDIIDFEYIAGCKKIHHDKISRLEKDLKSNRNKIAEAVDRAEAEVAKLLRKCRLSR